MPCAAKGPKVEWAGQLPVSGLGVARGVVGGVRCVAAPPWDH